MSDWAWLRLNDRLNDLPTDSFTDFNCDYDKNVDWLMYWMRLTECDWMTKTDWDQLRLTTRLKSTSEWVLNEISWSRLSDWDTETLRLTETYWLRLTDQHRLTEIYWYWLRLTDWNWLFVTNCLTGIDRDWLIGWLTVLLKLGDMIHENMSVSWSLLQENWIYCRCYVAGAFTGLVHVQGHGLAEWSGQSAAYSASLC